jgi:hypothetical protein
MEPVTLHWPRMGSVDQLSGQVAFLMIIQELGSLYQSADVTSTVLAKVARTVQMRDLSIQKTPNVL